MRKAGGNFSHHDSLNIQLIINPDFITNLYRFSYRGMAALHRTGRY